MTKLSIAVGLVVISTIASGQSTIQVDQPGNINLSTTPPASSAGPTGTQAPSPLAVQPVTGGADTGSSGVAGQGSSPSIVAGNGGTGNATSTTTGGAGGFLTLTTGNGGNSGSSANQSNGGDVLFNLGILGGGWPGF